MVNHRNIVGRLAFWLLFVLTLSGCSNNPYPADESSQSVLYRSLGDDPKTLDPSVGYDVDIASVITPIYPSYLQYNYLKRNPFVLELGLGATEPQRAPYHYTDASGGKSVARTGEQWTFQIKHGLRFQDDPCFPGGKGREILASDFLYCFRRMADPAVNCPIIAYFEDKILGMKEYEKANAALVKSGKKADYSLPMQGLQLDPEDPYAFRILLSKPYPQLRYLMAMTFTSPLAHEAVEKYGADLATHPVGCGPYLLAERRPKGVIVLKANPNYREEFYPSEGAPGDQEAGLLADAGKRLPFVKEVRFNIIAEGITNWNLFLQGYLDAVSVGQTNFQQALARPGELSPEMKKKGIGLHKAVSLDVSYFAFNMEDPVVGGYTPQRRMLRQAISLAINSQQFIDLLSLGLGEPAQSMIPPGLFGYDPNYKNPYRQFNLERAKQLLAEAGYPGGIDAKTGQRLTLYYDNYATAAAQRQQVALAIRQLQQLNIDVQPRSWRYSEFQSKMDHGQFQFTWFGWNADYPDPENFVFLLYGPNKRPGPGISAYSNATYDALFEKMRVMDDTPERLKVIEQMRTIAAEDCPYIYDSHSATYALTQPWFHNYKPDPVAADMVKYYRIDGKQRAELQRAWNHPNYFPAVAILLLLTLGSLPAARVVRQRTNRHVRRNSEG